MIAANSQTGRLSKRIIAKTLISLFFFICASRAIAAGNPQAVIQTGTDQVLQLLKQYPENTHERRQKIWAVVKGYFDFDSIAKRAVGPIWNAQSPEKQQEFTRDFSRLLFNTYMRKIEKYTNEKLTYRPQQVGGDHAVIEALVVGDQPGPIHIDYYLHLENGDWKVYDVVIEGVGLVVNYRSQFNEILSRSSFDDLLRQLREKVAQG
jgi:phospholipid transport system substrate-binding protein